MEHMSRGSLFDVLADHRDAVIRGKRADPGDPNCPVLTDARRVRLMVHAWSGLAFLHSRSPPVLHGDIKSLNLLIGAAPQATTAPPLAWHQHDDNVPVVPHR